MTRSRSAKVSTPSNQDCKRRILFTLPRSMPDGSFGTFLVMLTCVRSLQAT